MIKATYYIGTNDKNTLRRELYDMTFIKTFDDVFQDYTLQKAQGRFTNKDGQTTFEHTYIVTTFIDDCTESTLKTLHQIQENCDILKKELNQESILVEITKPEVMFL